MHSHHSHEKANCFTKAAAAGEFLNHFITNPYFLAQFFDLFSKSEPKYLGLSENSLYVAVPFCLSGIGAAYCHYVLNHNHQSATRSPLLTSRTIDHEGMIFDYDPDATGILGTPRNRNLPPLSGWQKFMLFGDGIAHVCEVAAPLSFVYDLATKPLNFPSWLRAVWQTGALFAGFAGAVAPVRTCYQSMMKAYSPTQVKKGDKWTTASLWIDGAANIVSNAAWSSQLLGAVLAFIKENQNDPIEGLDYTSWEFWSCIIVGILSGSTAAYCHYLLNKHHEKSSTQIMEPVESTIQSDASITQNSTCNIKSLLVNAADLFTHAGDKASSLSFIATLATRTDPMSKETNLAVQILSLVWGLWTGKADSRTCITEYHKELDLTKPTQANYSAPAKTRSIKPNVSKHPNGLFGSRTSINGDYTGSGNSTIVIPKPSLVSGASSDEFVDVIFDPPPDVRSSTSYAQLKG